MRVRSPYQILGLPVERVFILEQIISPYLVSGCSTTIAARNAHRLRYGHTACRPSYLITRTPIHLIITMALHAP